MQHICIDSLLTLEEVLSGAETLSLELLLLRLGLGLEEIDTMQVSNMKIGKEYALRSYPNFSIKGSA